MFLNLLKKTRLKDEQRGSMEGVGWPCPASTAEADWLESVTGGSAAAMTLSPFLPAAVLEGGRDCHYSNPVLAFFLQVVGSPLMEMAGEG